MKRTNPEIRETRPVRPKRAAAIRYDAAKDDAPRVTAKGSGHVARRIIELARRHDVPIREDRALVEILSQFDIDRQIPPELYRAVAEILAFVYSANGQYREQQGPGQGGPADPVAASRSSAIPSS